MPKLPLPTYGLESLYLFPYYQSREAYEKATGKVCPEWNPYRPPKAWFDPKALESPRTHVVYDSALVVDEKGVVARTADGKPALDVLVLPKTEAAMVNIPPKGLGSTNTPGASVQEVPVPLRALEPGEELYFGFAGVVAVRNLELYPEREVGFCTQDRNLLQAIAKKLGL